MAKAAILVIEDDAAVRRVVAAGLSRGGYEAIEAASGDEGVDRFIRERPDLVLCDLRMPGRAGDETIFLIRQLDPRVPIVAMSGDIVDGRPSMRDESMPPGATVRLGKPFALDELLSLVSVLLFEREQGRDALGPSG